MIWNNAADFFAMGGYAPYVWGSFGVTALGLAIEVWLARKRRQAIVHLIRREHSVQKENA